VLGGSHIGRLHQIIINGPCEHELRINDCQVTPKTLIKPNRNKPSSFLFSQYSCVAYGQPGGAPFYVTAGRDKICRLRHMINGACEHEIKIDGCQVTAVALVDHNKTLLAATDEGSVRVYSWFGNKTPGEWAGEKPGRFEELRLHQVRVSGFQSFGFSFRIWVNVRFRKKHPGEWTRRSPGGSRRCGCPR
jgi:hypothetical protein